MNISKNFTFEEFTASDTADRLGIINQVTSFEERDALTALVTEVLQPLRDRIRKPVHINSGYRCPELNAAVGGVPTSQHAKGEAADIVVKGMTVIELARQLREFPCDQIIVYPTFVHVSHKLHGKQRDQLLYNRTYKGPNL